MDEIINPNNAIVTPMAFNRIWIHVVALLDVYILDVDQGSDACNTVLHLGVVDLLKDCLLCDHASLDP